MKPRTKGLVVLGLVGGDYVLVDYSPPNPAFHVDYSARVCLHYKRSGPIEFTLPVRKIKHDTP